jgi:hypothetical protein
MQVGQELRSNILQQRMRVKSWRATQRSNTRESKAEEQHNVAMQEGHELKNNAW